MEALQALAPSAAERYRCPGEQHDIDRAIHLGRLATFYPGCRHCEHRHEVHTLSSGRQRQWAEVENRLSPGPQFTAEGLASRSLGDLDAPVVRRFALSLAVALWRRSTKGKPPAVLVGVDGHWSTAELLSVACQSLHRAGCLAIEAGAATAPSLANLAHMMQTDAALLIGNATGEPHSRLLKLWGPAGRPWSSPGSLDTVREIYETKVDRPQRRGGSLERAQPDDAYLPSFEPMFHGLRPLRFVMDTTCVTLLGYFDKLAANSACQVLSPSPSHACVAESDELVTTFVERRLKLIGREVVAQQAHFGLWIDGDGEACRLVDENGASVQCEKLLLLLAGFVTRHQADATLVVERAARAGIEPALRTCGARLLSADATREAMWSAIDARGAPFGGGPSGRFWFAGQPTLPDALLSLALLLSLLSQSDRPLLEVLDAAAPAL